MSSSDCIRIAMWSGPRNISTTMMRSFENRTDTAVVDEPLYAHYLATTGALHPMRDEVLADQANDWRSVVRDLTESRPAPVFFQKHMCHHITDDVERDWFGELRHFFLIREPKRMVASYAQKMETFTVEDLGLIKEVELFDHVTALTGRPPPVLDANQVLANPRKVLGALCDSLDIPFTDDMLTWPSGPRDSDGVWAPVWYHSVEASTGFMPPPAGEVHLPPELDAVVKEAQPAYDRLSEHLLSV